MRKIKLNDTTKPLVFLMIDSSNHISGKAGLTPTVTLSKNGSAFAAASGTVTEIGSGWYKLTPAAADVNTLGPLVLHAEATGADPLDQEFLVVAYDPYDNQAIGLQRLDAAVSSRADGAYYTSARATKLDNLDTTVGSRADGTYYTSARAAKLDNLDTTISSRATDASVWGYVSRTLTTAVDINMDQTLPATPTANTTGEALKFADTRLDTTVGSRADGAYYTSTRATKLDNLDATISSRATDASVWSYTSRTLTAVVDINMSQALPTTPTANTTGEALKFVDTRLDAAVSSRADGTYYTSTRATKLDNLDATISSRATDASIWGYASRTLTAFNFSVDINMNQALPTTPTVDTTGEALKFSDIRLDATVSSRADGAYYTSARAAKLDNLDATISSRSTDASVWGYTSRTLTAFGFSVTVGTNLDKSGYILDATGLDSIPMTPPSGLASNFRQALVQLWRVFFKKQTLHKPTGTYKTYADDGVTVLTTATWTDDGVTMTQNAAN